MVIGICEKNPDALVETVTYDVLRSLAVARVTASSPLVQTKSGKASAAVRRETLERMQSHLINLGHLKGAADGAYGPATEAALKAFQREQKLPQTGVPDSVTMGLTGRRPKRRSRRSSANRNCRKPACPIP